MNTGCWTERDQLRSLGIVSIAFIVFFVGILGADAETCPVEITGFGDFLYVVQQGAEDNFQIGQVEVDLEASIGEKIVASTAIAYNSEQEMFGLGAFTVDFHLFGSEGGHFRPLRGIEHSGILVGQFDVPFGIDWKVYPSIDRKLISSPLVVENTHEGWNDYGVQMYFQSGSVNGVVYGTNGLGDGVKIAVGGRLGLTPHESLEVGSSSALFLNEDDQIDRVLIGFDLQGQLASCTLKGEYLLHKVGMAGETPTTHWGFYGQGLYAWKPFFLVVRYGLFAPEDADSETRLSGGIGWIATENAEIRLEYQKNTGADRLFFQTVVAF